MASMPPPPEQGGPPSAPPSAPAGHPAAPSGYPAQPQAPGSPPRSLYAGGVGWAGTATPAVRPGAAAGLEYAGFWIRVVAYIIDVIIVSVPTWVIVAVVGLGSTTCTTDQSGLRSCTVGAGFWAVYGLAILIGVVYFCLTWSALGGTLGQKVFNIRVVDADNGRQISISRALLRYVGYIIAIVPIYLGLIWAAFDPRKQGWHDKIANTLVVRRY